LTRSRGKVSGASWRVGQILSQHRFGACLAKYELDGLRKQKGDISKAVAAKKKEDKKADISAETAQSKALDD